MGKIAFLFAGQGAQGTGMGRSLYSCFSKAKEAFNLVEKQRSGTIEDCFSASAERLSQTSVTQPCVYAVSLAAAAALEENGIYAHGAAGFSLGEMAALTYAGVFSGGEGARLVCLRGALMEKAAAEKPGAMAAVLRLDEKKVEELCSGFNGLWPVNYNCPGQTVVAGEPGEIDAFCELVKEEKGVARRLAVGGAFHTPFMENASAEFEKILSSAVINEAEIPVYSNLTGGLYAKPYKDILAAQMYNPVRWSSQISRMAADGYDIFIECGPGKTLSGLVRRICPDASVYNVEDEESLIMTVNGIKAEVGQNKA